RVARDRGEGHRCHGLRLSSGCRYAFRDRVVLYTRPSMTGGHGVREVDDPVDATDEVDLLSHETGPAFEGQRGHGNVPAGADLAHDIAQRDADVVVEHLAEVRGAGHRVNRTHGDSRRVHVADHPGDPVLPAAAASAP